MNKTFVLSKVERQSLDYFKDEFSVEMNLIYGNITYNEKHIYIFKDSIKNDLLQVDLGLRDSSGYKSKNNNAATTGTLYGGIRGTMRGLLAFMSQCEVSSEVNSDKYAYKPMSYNPVDGYPYNTFRDTGRTNRKSWDIFTSGIFIENRLFSAELCVDRMRWGPAERNAVTLSGDTPPMGLLKLETDFWKAHYIQTINIIKGTRYKDKYMYAHRVELSLPHTIHLGINEVLVYGDSTGDGDTLNPGTHFNKRSFDYIYAIPFVPYYFAQHYNGDRENTALSFDLAFNPVKRLKIYTELYLDDLGSPLSFFDKNWYNKWAVTMGGHYYFPFEKYDLSILMEYTRVEPWVYTHVFGESHRYRHYGQSLGTSIGPDGDEFYTGLYFKPDRKLGLNVFYRNKRQGYGRKGDNIADVHLDKDGLGKSFLGGPINTTNSIGLQAGLEVTRLFDIRGSLEQSLNEESDLSISIVFDFYW